MVQGVEVAAVTDTTVNISWDDINDYSVDFYTVVYSGLYRRQGGGEMSAVFIPPATSGVIAGLELATYYQFQVFASVTVNGVTLNGERSISVTSKHAHICILSCCNEYYD